MKRVLIVKNFYPLERDPRLLKISKILKDARYRITYLLWDRSCLSLLSYVKIGQRDSETVVMLARAPFGLRSFVFLPFWWLFEFIWLIRVKWDILHVVNFPSVIPAIAAAKIKQKPVIYDIEDTYVDQLVSPSNPLRSLGISIEKLCIRFVDAVLLVDEMQAEEFAGIPNSNVAVIYDSPPPVTSSFRTVFDEDSFKIFCAGYLSKERNLNFEPFLEAITDIEGVIVTFAGEGDLVEEIRHKACEMPGKIRYIGYIPYNVVLQMSCESDLLFSLREPYPLVQKYICGSKFLEATMCGRPILVNKGTSAAIKVMRDECGLLVDAHNVEEIKEAILTLKNDKEFWKKLAINAKKAYDQKYGWEIMKRRLLNLYANLVK
jgi:glycosyltransferase involved in cell wall biosynthesis